MSETTSPSLPKLPNRGIYTREAQASRVAFIENQIKSKVPKTPQSRIDPERLKKNIENFIGTIEVPVGVAGPLKFNGQHVEGLIYAPFATTEGALLATLTHGALALSKSGGVTTRVLHHRMIRVPVFDFFNINNAVAFAEWVESHIEEIKKITSKYTSHGRLVSIRCDIMGPSVFVEFEYFTADASGQNMTTTCTWHAILWIKAQVGQRFGIQNMMIESSSSSDKRASVYNFIKGRGVRVIAEAHIPERIAKTILGSTSEDMVRAFQRFQMSASHLGTIGVNINAANTIAAIFTATGQDIACTAESSVSYIHLEKTSEGFFISMLLPSLVIATVGGGTHLPHQREYLEMIDCYGTGKIGRLAEIIAGFTLALDICTLSALESGRFATAHEKLGRNRPVKWFTLDDLTLSFFDDAIKTKFGKSVELVNIEPTTAALGSSIISDLTAQKVDKVVGFFNYILEYKTGDVLSSQNIIVKIKPLDTEVSMMISILSAMGQSELAHVYPQFKDVTGFKQCDIRELAIYQEQDPRFVRHVPEILRTYRNDSTETRVVVMEYVSNVVLKDTGDDTSAWTSETIHTVLDGLAELHAIWYKKDQELAKTEWVGTIPSYTSMVAMRPLLSALLDNAEAEHDWFTDKDYRLRKQAIDTLEEWYRTFDELPKTLTHNDFNPRNLCIRVENDTESRLCVYDWELARIHLPQYDAVEFLIFVLQPETFSYSEFLEYIEYYRVALSHAVGEPLSSADWLKGTALCVKDFSLFRLGLYLMAHAQRDYGFMQRITSVSTQLLGCLP